MKEIKIGYVYIIISPTNRKYVGSTVNVNNRIRQYKTLNCKGQTKLYNSIKKHSWEKHYFKIIWSGNINNMYFYETKVALKLNTLSPENLNCKIPKLGDSFSFVSKETREK